jgi:hypothetical protein
MRRLAPPLLLVALLLAAAPPATAKERVISTDRDVYAVVAHGGTIVWSSERSGHTMWRSGTVSPLPHARARAVELGSDARGRTVAVFTRCRGAPDASPPKGCVVRAGGPTRGAEAGLLYRQRENELLPQGDLHRGNLALVAGGGPKRPYGVYVRMRGERKLHRLTGDAWSDQVTIGAGHVAFEQRADSGWVLKTIELDSDREEVVAIDDSFDNDCRCTGGVSSAGQPLIDGPYVYWLERHVDSATDEVLTRIGRARLGDPNAKVQYHDLRAAAASFAIRGSRVVYSPGSGVYEVTDAAWRTAGRIPAVN